MKPKVTIYTHKKIKCQRCGKLFTRTGKKDLMCQECWFRKVIVAAVLVLLFFFTYLTSFNTGYEQGFSNATSLNQTYFNQGINATMLKVGNCLVKNQANQILYFYDNITRNYYGYLNLGCVTK